MSNIYEVIGNILGAMLAILIFSMIFSFIHMLGNAPDTCKTKGAKILPATKVLCYFSEPID